MRIGKPATKTILLKNLPAAHKAYFKAYCARRGKTMNGVLLEFIRTCVKEELE